MWKYSANNAYDSISLHDCRADRIELEGNELIFSFPDGFWITPVSEYIDHDSPLKTGPSQVRFELIIEDEPFETLDIYKTTRVFRKSVLCRRIQPQWRDFLKMINSDGYELEFSTEYHSCLTSLYQCWIWKDRFGMKGECQLEIAARNIEYCWNEILPDLE